MYKIIKAKFIKKYWWNIVETDSGFAVINTYRKRNMADRDDIERVVVTFSNLEEAEKCLDEYEK